jgi:curli biogenesis system outer membrane secretion channel CsgG
MPCDNYSPQSLTMMDNLNLDPNQTDHYERQITPRYNRQVSRITTPLIAIGLIVSFGIGNIASVSAKEKIRSTIKPTAEAVTPKINKQKRPRIAVMDFDYSTIADEWRGWFQTNAKGVSDILVNKLVDGGNYSVIERTKIQEILREQNLGATDRIDANSAAKIGRLLGVQSIIIGSVTNFNVEKDTSGISVPFFGSVGGGKTTASVKLNVRVVDTSTGEIMFTAEGNGTSNHGDNSVNIRGFSFGNSGSNKEAKLLSTAAADAIEQLATKINSSVSKLTN